MSGLFLLNVQIEPCVRPSHVLNDAHTSLKKGVKKNNGKIMLCFKVIGENRILMVIDGDPDDALEELNAVCGSQVRITTTPLRAYQDFAEKVLKVEDKALLAPPRYDFHGKGKMFFLHARIDYKGMSQKELLDLWYRQALISLGLTKEPGGPVFLKVVGQREVILIGEKTDAGEVDDLVFSIPIMVELGNQIQVSSKAIKIME